MQFLSHATKPEMEKVISKQVPHEHDLNRWSVRMVVGHGNNRLKHIGHRAMPPKIQHPCHENASLNPFVTPPFSEPCADACGREVACH